MTKKEKKRILILVAIVIVIVVAMVISMSKKGKQQAENNPTEQNQQVNKEEFVQTLDDGTRLNTSTKLQETKRIEGLELSNFQVTAVNNETQLLGTIKNTSNTTQGDFLANIKVVDKAGKELTTVQVYIKEMKPGETSKLMSSNVFDYANAYDFSITKVQ